MGMLDDCPLSCAKHGPRKGITEITCRACADEHLAASRAENEMLKRVAKAALLSQEHGCEACGYDPAEAHPDCDDCPTFKLWQELHDYNATLNDAAALGVETENNNNTTKEK